MSIKDRLKLYHKRKSGLRSNSPRSYRSRTQPTTPQREYRSSSRTTPNSGNGNYPGANRIVGDQRTNFANQQSAPVAPRGYTPQEYTPRGYTAGQYTPRQYTPQQGIAPGAVPSRAINPNQFQQESPITGRPITQSRASSLPQSRSSFPQAEQHSDFQRPGGVDQRPYFIGRQNSPSGPSSNQNNGNSNLNSFGSPNSPKISNNGFVTPAGHETPNPTGEVLPVPTLDESPEDRLFLPRNEGESPEPISGWESWKQDFQTNAYIELKRRIYAATWIPAGNDELGLTDFHARLNFNLPKIRGLSLETNYQTFFLDGPKRTDLPSRLHRHTIGLSWTDRIRRNLTVEVGLGVGVYSDFDNLESDAFRVTGRMLGYYTTSPQTQWVFGFVYLNREDFKVLPAIGVIHVPDNGLRIELVFPRPKIAKRISQSSQHERWVYLAGELGGGSWAIERSNGNDDIATYKDLRFILGYEQRYFNGRSLMLEFGYVFDRQVEYERGLGDFKPSEAVMLRAGFVY